MDIITPNPQKQLAEGYHHFSYLLRRQHAPTKEYWELNYRFHRIHQSDFYSWWWTNFIRPFQSSNDALECRARHVLWRANVRILAFDYMACVRLRSKVPRYRHVCRLIVDDSAFAMLADNQLIDRVIHDEDASPEERVRAVIFGLTPLVLRKDSAAPQ